ncbi:MAG: segregation/condensation protein A [Chloroflexota bacterium]
MVDILKVLDEEENSSYQVELPDFEGPLDLLLRLIEREELDITTITLARVTDQYLAYLEILKEINPDELTDFLVIAAKLILIKSQALLPRPPPSIIEEEEEDLGEELARQLLLYKQFKEVATQLKEIEEKAERNFVRVGADIVKVEPKLVPGEISLGALLEAARQAMMVKPPEADVDEVVAPELVTIGQQMTLIHQNIQRQGKISFGQLLGQTRNRIEVIVTLLALLELIKRRVIKAEQGDLFGDIIIQQDDDVPSLTETEWETLGQLTDIS